MNEQKGKEVASDVAAGDALHLPPTCDADPRAGPGGATHACWSCTQEIGEELVNGVIYSISLRKVQAHHGTNKGQRWLG
ncbi:hypothetical protein GH733_019523, partial [Mirounga leonina]